jgi:hypothetical protein
LDGIGTRILKSFFQAPNPPWTLELPNMPLLYTEANFLVFTRYYKWILERNFQNLNKGVRGNQVFVTSCSSNQVLMFYIFRAFSYFSWHILELNAIWLSQYVAN